MIDLLIRGAVVVSSEGMTRGTIAVQDGRIAALDREDTTVPARETIDATNLYALPGLIDTHVHLRDPGSTEREDWLTGTKAAAAGGVTTILEMPVSSPSVHTVEILRRRAEHVGPRSIVDFGLYAGAGPENLDEIEGLAAAGAIGFKTFRIRAPRGRESEFVGIACPDAGHLLTVMERTALTGLPHVVHAEDQEILDVASASVRETGLRGGLAHARAHPEAAEVASVAQCIALAQATHARLQIAHVSTGHAVELVANARRAGLPVTAETCPHYLVLTEETLEEWGPYGKCDPPLRSRDTQEGLWDSVRSGRIDVIGSDHSPFRREEKAPFHDAIWRAPSGIPGLEEMLPLLLTAVNEGKLDLPSLVRLTSENPSKIFGLWPQKGSWSVGADADIVLVDLHEERTHNHHSLFTKARDSAVVYDGMRLVGVPVVTVVRGQVVMRNGSITGAPGWGKWIKPG